MYFKVISSIVLFTIFTIAFTNADYSDRDLINMIDNVDNELYLFGGLSVEKSKSSRSIPIPYGAESILDRAVRYLKSHELKFTVPDTDPTVEDARSGKLKKIGIPILLALKMKMAIILPLILKALTFISLKGLAAGTLALLFSGATLLKDLLSKKKEQVTTAYITGPSPITAEIVQSDWNRNGQAAQELAYNYHTLPQHGF